MTYEFDMIDNAVSQTEHERRQRMITEGEKALAEERAEEAKRAAKATARTLDNNRRQLLAEYERAGVEPPFVDENGKPTMSLSMLLRLGWSIKQISIEHVGDERVLLKPAQQQHKRMTREEWEQERGQGS